MTDYQPVPQEDGVADHAAPGLLDNRVVRTAVQGVAIDVAVAVAFVVYDATASADVDWRLLAASVARTAVQTAASWVMKRYRPAESTG